MERFRKNVEVKELEDAIEEVEEVEEAEQVISLLGVVSDCKKLNVRSAADAKAEPVCVVAEGSFLVIDPVESTNEWWKVYTEDGAEGYCMKKYVTINE